jgi:hypothetical protein
MYWVALAALTLVGGACLYAVVFYAWVTATPVPDAMRSQARQLAQWWAVGFGMSLLAMGAIVARMIVVSRR